MKLMEERVQQIIQTAKRRGETLEATLKTLESYEQGLLGGEENIDEARSRGDLATPVRKKEIQQSKVIQNPKSPSQHPTDPANMQLMKTNILEILKDDYKSFPVNQTYSIYAKNVYFKDPLNEFWGVERYKKMIGFLSKWFEEIKLELHDISRTGDTITTQWTLNMSSPLPWKPRLSIPGKSILKVNEDELIIAHVDYWHKSRWDVLKQNIIFRKQD